MKGERGKRLFVGNWLEVLKARDWKRIYIRTESGSRKKGFICFFHERTFWGQQRGKKGEKHSKIMEKAASIRKEKGRKSFDFLTTSPSIYLAIISITLSPPSSTTLSSLNLPSSLIKLPMSSVLITVRTPNCHFPLSSSITFNLQSEKSSRPTSPSFFIFC